MAFDTRTEEQQGFGLADLLALLQMQKQPQPPTIDPRFMAALNTGIAPSSQSSGNEFWDAYKTGKEARLLDDQWKNNLADLFNQRYGGGGFGGDFGGFGSFGGV